MAVTWTGKREFDRGIEALPAAARLHLRRTAIQTGQRIRARVSATASSRGWQLANEVVLAIEDDKGRVRVFIKTTPRKPANLPLWLEEGTRYMPARPFFRPAVRAEEGQYGVEMDRALQEAFDLTVNR